MATAVKTRRRPATRPTKPVISERDWQQTVCDFAQLTRWAVWHDHDSRRNAPGWPDLTLLRPPRIVFAELKTERGRLRPAQQTMIDLLRACGQEVYVWRPADWPQVMETLR